MTKSRRRQRRRTRPRRRRAPAGGKGAAWGSWRVPVPIMSMPTYSWSKVVGNELIGSDIGGQVQNVSVDQLKSMCLADPKCKAITYNKAWGTPGGGYLKSAQGPLNNPTFPGEFWTINR